MKNIHFFPFLRNNFFSIFWVVVFSLGTIFISQQIWKDNFPPEKHFALLAERYLEGSVSLHPTNGLPVADVVDWYDKRFVYFGPTPSLLMVPFVSFISKEWLQFSFHPIFLALLFIVSLMLGKARGFEIKDSIYIGIFFTFSTVAWFLGIRTLSAYLIQLMGLVFVILSLWVYFAKRNYLLVGAFIALAGMTRIPLYLSALFFLLEFIQSRIIFRNLVVFCFPIIISVIILGGYNYKRYHNVFETGYGRNITFKTWPMQDNLKSGFISLNHIPANLYVLLIKPLEPIMQPDRPYVLRFPYLRVDPWGFAIWFSSPLLIYFFINRKRDQYFWSSILTTGVLAITPLTFFSIGFAQYGYRYQLDFLVFLFLLLLPGFERRLTFWPKLLIIFGAIFNLIYMPSLWNCYPILGILCK